MRETRDCPACGKTFEPRPDGAKGPKRKYCSVDCGKIMNNEKTKAAHHANKPATDASRVERICTLCSSPTSVDYRAKNKEIVYCSDKCRRAAVQKSRKAKRDKARSGEFTCAACATKFRRSKIYGPLPKYCSNTCKKRYLRESARIEGLCYSCITRPVIEGLGICEECQAKDADRRRSKRIRTRQDAGKVVLPATIARWEADQQRTESLKERDRNGRRVNEWLCSWPAGVHAWALEASEWRREMPLPRASR